MYAYAALNEFHILPWVFAEFSDKEQAMIMAMLDEKARRMPKPKGKK